MIHVFDPDDKTPGAPTILPKPLVTAAMFLPANEELPNEVKSMILKGGGNPDQSTDRWVVEVWNRLDTERSIALATFTWKDEKPQREAIWVREAYEVINIAEYISDFGHHILSE